MKYTLIQKILREKILVSPFYLSIKSYDISSILECKIDSIGGVIYSKIHPFIALIQKVESLELEDNYIIEILTNEDEVDDNKDNYNGNNINNIIIKLVFIFYFRLKNADIFMIFYKKYKNFQTKVKFIDEDNKIYFVTVGQIMENLRLEKYYCDIYLKRMEYK